MEWSPDAECKPLAFLPPLLMRGQIFGWRVAAALADALALWVATPVYQLWILAVLSLAWLLRAAGCGE